MQVRALAHCPQPLDHNGTLHSTTHDIFIPTNVYLGLGTGWRSSEDWIKHAGPRPTNSSWPQLLGIMGCCGNPERQPQWQTESKTLTAVCVRVCHCVVCVQCVSVCVCVSVLCVCMGMGSIYLLPRSPPLPPPLLRGKGQQLPPGPRPPSQSSPTRTPETRTATVIFNQDSFPVDSGIKQR